MAKANSYDADSIAVLEGLEAVRKRPGMYIGSVSRKGLNHLIYEIVDNAVDEHLAGYCNLIHVTLEADGSATVSDDGTQRSTVWACIKRVCQLRGLYLPHCMPAENLMIPLIRQAAVCTVSARRLSMALSEHLDVKVYRDGCIYHDSYSRGVPTTELIDGLLPIIGKARRTGTTVNFLPDAQIFERTDFKLTKSKAVSMKRRI